VLWAIPVGACSATSGWQRGAMEGATISTYPLVGKKIITQPKHTALRLLWGIGFGVSAQ
jgi:hypothetical protein